MFNRRGGPLNEMVWVIQKGKWYVIPLPLTLRDPSFRAFSSQYPQTGSRPCSKKPGFPAHYMWAKAVKTRGTPMSVGPSTTSLNKQYVTHWPRTGRWIIISNIIKIHIFTQIQSLLTISMATPLDEAPHSLICRVLTLLLWPRQSILYPTVSGVFKTHPVCFFCFKTFQGLHCHTWNKSQLIPRARRPCLPRTSSAHLSPLD